MKHQGGKSARRLADLLHKPSSGHALAHTPFPIHNCQMHTRTRQIRSRASIQAESGIQMASKFTNGSVTASLVSCAVALPLAALAADAVDVDAATAVAMDTKFTIDLAAACGTPIASQPNVQLERFAIALALEPRGFTPQKLSQAVFQAVIASAFKPESISASAKRAAELAATSDGCQQPENIKYWNFLRAAGGILSKRTAD